MHWYYFNGTQFTMAKINYSRNHFLFKRSKLEPANIQMIKFGEVNQEISYGFVGGKVDVTFWMWTVDGKSEKYILAKR